MDKLSGTPQPRHEHRPPKVVFIGDSLTQGTEDAVTTGERQAHGWAQVLSRQIGQEPNAAYIGKNGIPFNPFVNNNTLDIAAEQARQAELKKDLGPLTAVTWYVGAPPIVPPLWELAHQGTRTKESRNTPEHPQNNFAVPGAKSRHIRDAATPHDMLQEVHTGLMDAPTVADQAPLTQAVLQNGGLLSHGTQLQQAIGANPDVVMLWGANNDALHGDLIGHIDDFTLTPLKDQKYTYQATNPVNGQTEVRTTPHKLEGIESIYIGKHGIIPQLLKKTDADIFVMTVPQIEVTPSMATVGQKIGPVPFNILLPNGTDVTRFVENFTIPTAVAGPGKNGRTEFPAGSLVSLFTVIGALSSLPASSEAELADRLKAATGGLLTEDQVADPDEQAIVHDRTNQFNQVFQKATEMSPRVHLIDTGALLQKVKDNGQALIGDGPAVTVTNTFTGVQKNGMEGIFSHDGLHPSDTGYAVLANHILSQMQRDLAGRPRFEAIEEAEPVDEKAVFAQDPHRGQQAAVVLDPQHAEVFRQMVR